MAGKAKMEIGAIGEHGCVGWIFAQDVNQPSVFPVNTWKVSGHFGQSDN
jgi:hypothetical protein